MEGHVKTGLRIGHTTGACASAASKAATIVLLHGTDIENLEIPFPNGKKVKFSVHKYEIGSNRALAFVIKDAGDDYDVANAAEIVAEASIIESSQLNSFKTPKIHIIANPYKAPGHRTCQPRRTPVSLR